MTGAQFAAWALMVLVCLRVMQGWRLARAIAFTGAWQAFTPVREAVVDVPLMVLAFCLSELAFHLLAPRQPIRRLRRPL